MQKSFIHKNASEDNVCVMVAVSPERDELIDMTWLVWFIPREVPQGS